MPTTHSFAVATQLRIELATLDVSQAELARRLNCSSVWLHRRMRGPVPFTIDDLHAICGVLELDVADLLSAAAARREAAVSA